MYSTTEWAPWSPSQTPVRTARPPIRSIGKSHPIRHPNSPTRAIALKGCSHQKPMPLVKTVVIKIRRKSSEFEQLLRAKLTAHKKKKQVVPEERSPRVLMRSNRALAYKPQLPSSSSKMPPMFNKNVFQDEYIPTNTDLHSCEYKFCCEDDVQKDCTFCRGRHDDHHCGTILKHEERNLIYLAKDICRICGKRSEPDERHHRCIRRKCIYCSLSAHVSSMCKSAQYQGMMMMVDSYKVVYKMYPIETKDQEGEKMEEDGGKGKLMGDYKEKKHTKENNENK